MSERLWDTLTFAAVGLPAVVFAIGKAYLAFLMYRGTRIRTPLGLWLMRLYAVVAEFEPAQVTDRVDERRAQADVDRDGHVGSVDAGAIPQRLTLDAERAWPAGRFEPERRPR